MADTVALRPSAVPAAVSAERTRSIPWYLWTGLLATTSAVVGGQWDISWHRSIGRDSFWTPAHIAIYFCGVLAGLSSGYVALSTTFGLARERARSSVRLWGFRAPLGAFLCIWGAVAMLTSAPFDDWWHSAYGLDVKILSPPHMLLALGLMIISVGALVQVLGEMNRAAAEDDRRSLRLLEAMFLYGAGLITTMLTTVIMEKTFRNLMHTATFYRDTTPVALLCLGWVSRACPRRWAATIAATIYSFSLILLILILPLFPAEPKLGPVFQQVKFFIPPEFPLLLILPALALDWLVKRYESLNQWALSALAGAAFFLVFLAVQWPFANFLMSPWSRNWFFGSHYMPYYASPNGFYARFIFFPAEPPGTFLWMMGSGLVFSILAARFSLGWGDWMRRIRR